MIRASGPLPTRSGFVVAFVRTFQGVFGIQQDVEHPQDDSKLALASTADQNEDNVNDNVPSADSSHADEFDYLTKDMELNTNYEPDVKKLSFCRERYHRTLPSNELVMKIIKTVDVRPIIADNKTLLSLQYFANSCLSYKFVRTQQLFEPDVMTNEFQIKVEEFVGITALMCDSEMINSLKGVGVPEDTMEKFKSLQNNFGKCMIVGKSSEVDVSNFDTLQDKVTYDLKNSKNSTNSTPLN